MKKILLISGSPRAGNTEFVLKKLKTLLSGKTDLVLLREKHLNHCKGCLSCDKTNKCVILDDMKEILKKLVLADIVVIGTPNYFENVTGLLKDFIDRTNPFYGTRKLKGKKLIVIVTGEMGEKSSKKVLERGFSCFVKCHQLKLKKAFYFKAAEINDISENLKSPNLIKEIADYVNKNG